jgi:hypothetical protein
MWDDRLGFQAPLRHLAAQIRAAPRAVRDGAASRSGARIVPMKETLERRMKPSSGLPPRRKDAICED